MGSKQVANDTIKLLAGAMLVMFVAGLVLPLIDCAGVATGLQEPDDPYATFEADLERAIEEAEARREARWKKRYGNTGNGRSEKPIGAFYPGGEPEAAAPASDGMLWMAGGLLLSMVGCLGAVGFLVMGGRNEPDEAGPNDEAPAPAAAVPDSVVPYATENRAPEAPLFDEYGRPADYEPEPLQGYWSHQAMVLTITLIGLAILLIGPLPLAIWLGLSFGG